MITKLTEDEYYNLEKGKYIGVFYFKSNYPRWYCVVFKKDREPIRNIWNNEEFAFDWMKRVEECFDRC